MQSRPWFCVEPGRRLSAGRAPARPARDDDAALEAAAPVAVLVEHPLRTSRPRPRARAPSSPPSSAWASRAALSGARTARTFCTAVTVFSTSESVMSSAKSDESSCQSEAAPESVATWRLVVEHDPVRLSVARPLRIADERHRVLLRASAPRTARARPCPRTCWWGRSSSIRSAERRSTPLSTRAACVGVPGQEPETAGRRARPPWRRRPCVRPTRRPTPPSRTTFCDVALRREPEASLIGPPRGSSRRRAAGRPTPSRPRGGLPRERHLDLRRRQPLLRFPQHGRAAGQRRGSLGLPSASKFRRLSSAVYWRSTGVRRRRRRRRCARPSGREDPAHAARAVHPLGVPAGRSRA